MKMVTSCASLLADYMMYTGDSGVYTYTFSLDRKPDCPVCGTAQALELEMGWDRTLEDLLNLLMDRTDLQVR
jgi:ubiquitin-activating enzyme E1 C